MDPPVEAMETEGAHVEGGQGVFGPLAFPGPTSKLNELKYAPWEVSTCQCSVCEATFQCPQEIEAVRSHIYNKHSVLIANIEHVACLKDYLEFWRVKFQEKPFTQYGTKFLSEGQEYNRLNSCPEDNEIRNKLLKKRLEWILDCQTEEREDKSFVRRCFFCRHVEKGSRYKYVTHLSYHHNFQLGKPENLVFIDKLLDKVEETLNRLECIYCGHAFRERNILKEHMRKKFHKRINPRSREFDPYYIVFYLQDHQRRYWTKNRVENSYEINTLWSEWCEEGTDWSEWCEDPLPIICLFCTESVFTWEEIMEHMQNVHGFNYKSLTAKCNFYEQVKIVNFIRREVHLSNCYHCKLNFQHRQELLTHMTTSNHFTLPARQDWDHPQFFFSTYENDMFLSLLEDEEEDPLDQLSSQLGKGFSLQQRPESPDTKPSPKYIKLDDCLQMSEQPKTSS